MKRSPLLRYWPLAALLAVQALIIAVAPSTAPSAAAGFGPGVGAQAVAPGAATGSAATTTSVAAAGGPGSATATTSAAGGGHGGAASSGAAVFNPGDTSHCSGSREFSTSIVWFAPPCTAGTIGAADPSNGGATYQLGVSSNQITIVDYVTDYGPEVNAILQAEGQYVSYSGEKQWDSVMQNFINSHFVLYGRKVKIITYQGQCQSVPPDTTCLTAEMDSIVNTYNPYVIMWVDNTVCSTCYAEIAKDHVVALGGDGFSDQLADELAPYFYTAHESATRIETAFAQWWCNQMTSVGTSRVVSYAGTQNPAQNFNGQPRRLGVISTNDPDNENTVTNVLEPALAKCGDKVWHTYFYSQNINTAAQQVSAGIAAMDTTTNPANAVLCLCDPVAPQFLYQGESDANYWPENLVASDQLMDLDSTSQNYESGASCPGSSGCEYTDAFGLSPIEPQEPEGQDSATRIWTMEGQPASTLASVMGSTGNADNYVLQFIMMASLLENAGPDLTPARMQAAAPDLGTTGGGSSGHPLLAFSAGDWDWTQDARVVFWDNNAKSAYNGANGTFCQVEGTRFNLGQYPSESGGPPIPTGSRPSTCP